MLACPHCHRPTPPAYWLANAAIWLATPRNMSTAVLVSILPTPSTALAAGAANSISPTAALSKPWLHSAYGFLYLYADTLKGELIDQGDRMWPDQQGEGWPSWTFSNHDAPRAVSRWAQGRDEKAFAEMALLLLMCLRGNVFVYQGEELGLPQAEVPFERLVDPEAIANWPQTLGRDGARTPIPWIASAPNAGFSTVEPWLPVDPRHLALAVDAQEADPTSILHAARRIIALRQAHPALRIGGLEIESAGDLVVFRRFERAEGGERLLCVFNLGFTAMDWSPPVGARRIAAVNWTETDGAALRPLAGLIFADAG